MGKTSVDKDVIYLSVNGVLGFLSIKEWFETANGFQPNTEQLIDYILHTSSARATLISNPVLIGMTKPSRAIYILDLTKKQHELLQKNVLEYPQYKGKCNHLFQAMIAICHSSCPTVLSAANMEILKQVISAPNYKPAKNKKKKILQF